VQSKLKDSSKADEKHDDTQYLTLKAEPIVITEKWRIL